MSQYRLQRQISAPAMAAGAPLSLSFQACEEIVTHKVWHAAQQSCAGSADLRLSVFEADGHHQLEAIARERNRLRAPRRARDSSAHTTRVDGQGEQGWRLQ